MLLSGKVCVGGRRDRHKLVLNEMYPGVVFGFSSLFEGEKHFETDICACRKSEVLWLEEALIEELLGLERRVGRNIIALQAEKIRFLNEKVLSFSSWTMKKAVAVSGSPSCFRRGQKGSASWHERSFGTALYGPGKPLPSL